MSDNMEKITMRRAARALELRALRIPKPEKKPTEKTNPSPDGNKYAVYLQMARENKKPLMIGGGVLLGILLLGFGYIAMTMPRQGSMFYGACKTFLELYVEYPEYLRLTDVYEFPKENSSSVRIWFTQLDGFGQYRMEPLECFYKSGPKGNFYLDKITLNRREIDPAKVGAFNKLLPTLQQIDIDLSYPPAIPLNINGLKFNPDKYRRKIL